MGNSATGGSGARDPARRKLLKVAVTGGVVGWTVPAVQTISMSAAHAQATSEPPTTEEPPPSCKAISNVQVVVLRSGMYFGLKYDPEDDAFEPWSSAAPDSNDCIRYFEQQHPEISVVPSDRVADRFNDHADVAIVDDCEWRLILPLPTGYTYVQGYVKAGNVSEAGCPGAGTPTATFVPFYGV